jgi:hypothetical protein
MTRRFPASLLLLVFLAGGTPLLAHHGNASYENKESHQRKSDTVAVDNPHTFRCST